METALLNSGGADSYMVAKQLHADGYSIHSIFIDFGQPNIETAKVCAKATADKFCVSHDIVKIDGIDMKTLNSGIFGIPFQGALTLMLGVSKARSEWDLDTIYGGHRSEILKVTSEDFIDRLNKLMSYSSITNPVIPFFPLLDSPMEYDNDEDLFNNTVSCNQPEPCGVCPKCLHRSSAIEEATNGESV